MLYSHVVERSIRQSFDHVNNHRWDEALKAVAPHVHHRVSGAHALGRSHGGFATKLHLVTDGTGLPLARATATPASGHGYGATACALSSPSAATRSSGARTGPGASWRSTTQPTGAGT